MGLSLKTFREECIHGAFLYNHREDLAGRRSWVSLPSEPDPAKRIREQPGFLFLQHVAASDAGLLNAYPQLHPAQLQAVPDFAYIRVDKNGGIDVLGVFPGYEKQRMPSAV